MDSVRIEGVSFEYGTTPVVRGVSLAVARGIVDAAGAVGLRKTTLLKLIGGYLTPTPGGSNCRRCHSIAARARNAGMVFQNYALFPHLTARGECRLRARRVERARRADRPWKRCSIASDYRRKSATASRRAVRRATATGRARAVIEPDALARRAAGQSRPAPSRSAGPSCGRSTANRCDRDTRHARSGKKRFPFPIPSA